MERGATGCASGLVHRSEMMRDVGGGCAGEEGQKDESLFLLHFLVQGKQLEPLPLLH